MEHESAECSCVKSSRKSLLDFFLKKYLHFLRKGDIITFNLRISEFKISKDKSSMDSNDLVKINVKGGFYD